MMADDGLARAIYPVHTMSDGDTMFSLATGHWDGLADVSRIGALAAEVVAEAIVRAVARADSLGGFASAKQTGTVPPRMK
jgi:L-aminopeptidase/D-esterase-like protein